MTPIVNTVAMGRLSSSRRRLITGVVGAAVVLAACGSDASTGEPPATVAPEPTDTLPPATTPPEPAGGDDGTGRVPGAPAEGAILEIGYYGGFTPFEVAFQRQPSLVVAADGTVLFPAAVPAIFPGPLLPQHTAASLTPEGIRLVLEEIDGLGLLADVDYTEESLVADASTAPVIVRTADDTFRHEAYALGIAPTPDADDQDRSPERAALARAIDRLTDLRSVVGDELGPETPWQPEAYQLIAQPAGDLAGLEPAPRFVDWPVGTGVALAEATACVEIPRDRIGSVLDDADQLTYFLEGDETFQVVARPVYPGRSC